MYPVPGSQLIGDIYTVFLLLYTPFFFCQLNFLLVLFVVVVFF